ncbi:MAG: STAS/SEC14 domain-containing protein [Syntrophobacteraceae bacterium]
MFDQLTASGGNVLGFKIGENITSEDVRKIGVALSDAISEFGKVRLLIEIEGFRHMEPEALLEKLRFARDHAGEIERMAVVSGRIWIKSWVKIGGLFTHREVEHFDRSEIEAAWEWLRG